MSPFHSIRKLPCSSPGLILSTTLLGLGSGEVDLKGQTPLPDTGDIPILDAVRVKGEEHVPTSPSGWTRADTISEEQLKLRGDGSLGEVLRWEPGVRSSGFGTAAGRPIIRGFSGYKVRMLQDGLGTGDVSDLSPDHAVGVDPSSLQGVQVLRGPATLEYGGAALGGAVNMQSTHLPTELPQRPLTGNFSMRYDSVSDGITVDGESTLAQKGWVFRFTGLRRDAGNYHIPGAARLNPPAGEPNPQDRLPNSFQKTDSLSLGLAKIWDRGQVGVAASLLNGFYGIPFHEEGHGHVAAAPAGDAEEIAIDMQRKRVDFNLEWEPANGPERLTYRLGFTDYQHAELEEGVIATGFAKQEWEGRLITEMELQPGWQNRWGLSHMNNHFVASGPETSTPENRVFQIAPFWTSNLELGPVDLQGGLRFEQQNISLPTPVAGISSYRQSAFSASAGATLELPRNWEFFGTLTFSQRPPSAAELFSDGSHLATSTYEVGALNPVAGVPGAGPLRLEEAVQMEIGLRRNVGRWTGELTYFHYEFSNYIFLSQVAPAMTLDGLPVYRYTGVDARIRGLEFVSTYQLLAPELPHQLDWTFSVDGVRADDRSQNVPLPRIPALRVSNRLEWSWNGWTLGGEVEQIGNAGRIRPGDETPTQGYTLLHADLRYRTVWNDREATFFLRGVNLSDQVVRNHQSFIKDEAPLPGRNISMGLSLQF